jgi:L-threonylcarbamoyladenylate synthase
MSIFTQVPLAAQLLKQGLLVGIPTETVYGLGGNGLDASVVLEIFKAKGRPTFDPLILHVASLAAARKWVKEISPVAFQLGQTFWPGPLTLLLPKKDIVPDIVTSGSEWVGVRVPAHPVTLSLLTLLDFPLAAPSANPFGYISPTTAQHVMDQLGDKIAGVLEGGPSYVGIESTVVKVLEDKIEIYRPGAITAEQLTNLTGLSCIRMEDSEHPTAPGMLTSHYAPRKPLFLKTSNDRLWQKGEFWIRFQYPVAGVPAQAQRILAPDGKLETAARNLFAVLRELDANSEVKCIYAEGVPNTGLGVAINDKLKRASHQPES